MATALITRSVDLPSGWGQVYRYHEGQHRYYDSTVRNNVVAAGRRGGKSGVGRRRFFSKKAMRYHRSTDGYMTIHAPTRDQVKRLHWEQLKSLVPRKYIAQRNGMTLCISESELSIRLAHNNCLMQLLGMDKPARAEGMAIDHALIDEVADMKASVWPLSIRPSLSTDGRPGSADFIGKPRGINHFHDLFQKGLATKDWMRHHWTSASVLCQTEAGKQEIEAAQRDLDPLHYRQEYEAEFVLFEGRAYYNYDPEMHATHELEYDGSLPLELVFDFNRSPGVCGVVQEQDLVHRRYPGLPNIVERDADCIIDEVYREHGSNTQIVCRALSNKYGRHQGYIYVYGDASGEDGHGQRHSSSLQGGDWDIVKRELQSGFPYATIVYKVPRANPRVRTRVNTMNAALLNAADRVRTILCKRKAQMSMRDFASTPVKDDGSGEIDKDADWRLSHLSDGYGYRACVVRSLADASYEEVPLSA